jgi:hypothetical protein
MLTTSMLLIYTSPSSPRKSYRIFLKSGFCLLPARTYRLVRAGISSLIHAKVYSRERCVQFNKKSRKKLTLEFMKKIFFLFFFITLLSCTNESENLKQEIVILKAKNDSLNTILDTLKTKFIFDKAFVKHIVNDNKPMKVGEKYEGAFYFVAFNSNDKILFKQDLNSKPDTLSNIRDGGYTYEFIAKKGKNNFHFKPLILNKTSKEFSNTFFDVNISDTRIVD